MSLQSPKNWFKKPLYLDQIRHPVHRLLNNIFTRIFQYKDITKWEYEANGSKWEGVQSGHNSLYLRRFYIIRKGPLKLFLHFINRSDTDRHLHDHQWTFKSLILSGGYMEELPSWWPEVRKDTHSLTDKLPSQHQWRHAAPGTIISNKAEHLHQVHLFHDQGYEMPAWTLVHVGPHKRIWGFLTEEGWINWYTYLGLTYEQSQNEDIY